jgi:hypothetical protein
VIGFTRRQVQATVAWQATAFALAALATGVPIGIVVGRWAWTAAAGAIGAPTATAVPASVLAIVAGVVLVANLAAALPAAAAGRLTAAAALRTE